MNTPPPDPTPESYETQAPPPVPSWDTLAPTEHDLPPPARPRPAGPPPAGLRYRVVRPHARGGLGEVFLAQDGELPRQVALKEIQAAHADDPGSRERFVHEAEITGALEHPGIVPVYGLGSHPDGRPFYAMRFIRGRTLGDAIRSFHRSADGPEKRLAFRELLGGFVAVCDAVAYAHSKGVVHRDLKPSNVMLGEFGETLVVDWGLAKVVGEPDGPAGGGPRAGVGGPTASTVQTQAGSVLGTPAYMSPEQAAGRTDAIGPASDVYSLGATLYELLAGRPPLADRDLPALLEAVRLGRVPPPRSVNPAVPKALDAVCMRAMALRPEDRYGSAKDLADEVRRWLADEPVRACREPLTARAARWARRHRTLVASATALSLAVVVALAVGLALLGREQMRTEEARRKARDNFRHSREVVNRLVHVADSPDGLRDVPGMAALRRQILEEALAYYEGFLAEQSDDPDVTHEAGRGFMLAGTMRREDGREFEAEQAFVRARDLLAGMTGRMPGSTCRIDLVRCHVRLGLLYQDQRRLPEAVAEYRAAEAVAGRLAAESPDDSEPRYQLAAVHLNRGTALRAGGDDAGGEAEYRAGLPIAEALAARPGASAMHRATVAHFHNGLGNVEGRRGRWKEADAELAAATEVWRQLADELPNVPEHRVNLATAEYNRGDALSHLGRTDDSLAAADRSLALWGKLAADFPTAPSHRAGLANAYFNRGVFLRAGGRPTDAEAPMREAVRLRRELAGGFAGQPRHRELVGGHLSTLADLRDDLGRPREAEADHREAVTVLRGLVADHGGVPAYRNGLADAANSLAAFLINHERAGEAEGPANEAIALWRRLTDEVPADPRYHANLGMALGNLFVVRQWNDDPAGARRAVEEAVVHHDRAVALAPGIAGYRKKAAVDSFRLANAAFAQGDHGAAVAAAAKLIELDYEPTEALYLAACTHAQCIRLAENDATLPEPRRRELAQAYQDQALGYLRRLKKYVDMLPSKAAADPGLAALQKRVDLNAALADPPVSDGGKDR